MAVEAPAGADEIEIVLQRASPGAVDRDEILAETGLSTDDGRAAFAYLEEEGRIKETANGGYQAADGSADSLPDEAEPGDRVAEALAANHAGDESGEEPPGPALDAHVRTTFEVSCSFGRGPNDSDDLARRKAEALSAEIGNALAVAFPRLDFHVEISGVDSFDEPRSLWPAST